MSRRNDVKGASDPLASEDQARRDFLKKAGRFAVVTPPAITLLLGTSLESRAIAKSAGSGGKGGSHPGSGSAISFFKRHKPGQ